MADSVGAYMSFTTIGQIRKGIKNVRESKQFEKESLSNIEQVFIFGLDVKRKAKKKIKISPAFTGVSKEKLKRGESIADFSKIVINRNFLLDIFKKICEIRTTFGSGEKQSLSKFMKAIKSGKIDLMKLQKNVAVSNQKYFSSISKKVGVNKELLYSVTFSVYKPIFELCAAEKQNFIEDYKWKKGSCPICGTTAAMAKFEKEVGRRLLWCPLCGTEWVFQRIKCPFCDNENQDSLRYFYLEAKSPYRVDVCDECKGYVKTVDERKRSKDEKTIFETEDLMTVFLDTLAEKEGYKRI